MMKFFVLLAMLLTSTAFARYNQEQENKFFMGLGIQATGYKFDVISTLESIEHDEKWYFLGGDLKIGMKSTWNQEHYLRVYATIVGNKLSKINLDGTNYTTTIDVSGTDIKFDMKGLYYGAGLSYAYRLGDSFLLGIYGSYTTGDMELTITGPSSSTTSKGKLKNICYGINIEFEEPGDQFIPYVRLGALTAKDDDNEKVEAVEVSLGFNYDFD